MFWNLDCLSSNLRLFKKQIREKGGLSTCGFLFAWLQTYFTYGNAYWHYSILLCEKSKKAEFDYRDFCDSDCVEFNVGIPVFIMGFVDGN